MSRPSPPKVCAPRILFFFWNICKVLGAFCVEVIFEDVFDHSGRSERAHRIDRDAAPQEKTRAELDAGYDKNIVYAPVNDFDEVFV